MTQWFNRTSQSFVKKKAALTLLRLYRKHPEVIPAAEWALRIVSIMDDNDLVSILAINLFSRLTILRVL
jgi:AP-2 complex subunit alpha